MRNYNLSDLCYRGIKNIFLCFGVMFYVFISAENVDSVYGYTRETKSIIPGKNAEQKYHEFMDKLDEKISKLKHIAGSVYQLYLERDQIDLDKSFEEIYKGFMEGMDKHSTYSSKEDVNDQDKFYGAHFGGIGVRIEKPKDKSGYPVINQVIKEGPAALSGMIDDGDKLMLVDGKSMQGIDQLGLLKSLRGPIKSEVNVRIIKTKQANKLVDLKLIRAEYDNTSVIYKPIPDEKLAYVLIDQFHVNTGKEFVKIVDKIKKDIPDFRGMILDLRNNFGGTVSAALEVADHVLDSGKILISRSLNEEVSFSAEKGDILDGAPIIVLVTNNTASASEILSAALQDNNRAKLVGVRTFGKGVIQQMLDVRDGSRLKITISKFFSPNDKPIQIYGVKPDITVFSRQITQDDLNKSREFDFETRFSDIKSRQDVKDLEDVDLSKGFMHDQRIVIAIDLINDWWKNLHKQPAPELSQDNPDDVKSDSN